MTRRTFEFKRKVVLEHLDYGTGYNTLSKNMELTKQILRYGFSPVYASSAGK